MSEQTALQRAETPDTLLAQGIEKGLDVESLSKLMDLRDRWEANQARKAFFEAFTDFQSSLPDLRKTKKVSFGQGKAEYNYAPLADITRQIAKILKSNDLSYRWEIKDDKETLSVTCLVSHIQGHTERTTMQANPDLSGSKNAIQARGSAIEYLKRYTLVGALGLSTTDSDLDGHIPDYDLDKLHKEYMSIYNQCIQIDPKMTRWHPDEWKKERTGPVYVKAIAEIGKELLKLKPTK